MTNRNVLVARCQSNLAFLCLAILIARRDFVILRQGLHLVDRQISGFRGTVTNAVFGWIAAIHTNLDDGFPIAYLNSAERYRQEDANGRSVIQKIIGVSPGQDTLFILNFDPMDIANVEKSTFPP